MTKRQDRRAIVPVAENVHARSMRSLGSQSNRYFQSFMLLRDAAACDARRQPIEHPFSRFVPSAIVSLHAFMDAHLNHKLALALEMNPELPSDIKQYMKRLMAKSLSSASGKAKTFAEAYALTRPFSDSVIESINLFCDLRDVLFHTEPEFLYSYQFPAPAEKICRRAGVRFRPQQPWCDHASDISVLEWTYDAVKAYFQELADATGGQNDLDDTVGGVRIEYRNQATGELVPGWSMEEMWAGYRRRLYTDLALLTESAP